MIGGNYPVRYAGGERAARVPVPWGRAVLAAYAGTITEACNNGLLGGRTSENPDGPRGQGGGYWSSGARQRRRPPAPRTTRRPGDGGGRPER